MAGIFGGKGVSPTSPVISSLQLQTSAFGRPVPWVFGRQRVAPNLIQYEGFRSIAHTKKQGGGKGGGGGGGTTDYTYTVAAVMALCSGPIDTIGKVWKDKEKTTTSALNLDFYTGANDQNAYPYILSMYPERALPYRGLAYVASGAYDLGSQATFGNHTYEVQALGSIAATYPNAAIPDAEPANVISAILTDVEQGVGLDPASVADMSQFRAFCLASGLHVSPAYNDQLSAYECIKNLLMIGFSDCVYSGGVFKIVPYSDVAATNNLADYIPNIAPVEHLTDDHFLGDADNDAIRITQKPADTSYNHVQIKFGDRANDYNDNIATSTDDADIEQFGIRKLDVMDCPEIADAAVAQKVADYILHRSLYIQNTYRFKLPWSFVRLEPMDVVTLTYPRKYLDRTPVLIIEVDEDESGVLTFTAEDYPLGSNSAGTQPVPVISSTTPNTAITPGGANVPILFEPPGAITGNVPELWLATSGGPSWGGAIVWASLDGITYKRIGTLRGGATHGVLASTLATGGDAFGVDLQLSGAELSGTTAENASALLTACYVGGEYLAYAGSTLSGQNAYQLTGLVRGAYGSTANDHAQGEPFVYLASDIFKFAYPRDWVGRTIHIKLASFNRFGNTLQDLSLVAAHTHTIIGAQVKTAQNLVTTAQPFSILIGWSVPASSADYLASTEVWYSKTANRGSAVKLDAVASPGASYTLSGLDAGATYYFWVRLIDRMGNVGDFYPSGAGVVGTSSKDAKIILDWLAGQIGLSQLGIDLRRQIDLLGNLPAIQDRIGIANLNIIIGTSAQILDEAQARGAAVTELRTSTQTTLESHAGQITTVTAAIGNVSAAVQIEATARASADLATAQQITTVAAQTAAALAAVQIETTARADADGAMAQQLITVTAQTGSALAAVQNETVARTNADLATAQQIATLTAQTGSALAAVQNETVARTNADGALTQGIVTAQSTANGASAVAQTARQTLAETNGKLSALTTIRTQVTTGGRTYMAGIGVGVEVSGPVVESQILLSAARVAIVDEIGGAIAVPFTVQNGQVFINSAFIGNASIGNAKIGYLAVDTLQIAGSAVTLPLYVSGTGGASGISNGQWITVGSVVANYSDVANLVIMANWQAGCPGGATNTAIRVTANGQTIMQTTDSAVASLVTSHSATGHALLPAGVYTFQISFGNDWPSNYWNLGNWGLSLIGLKK